MQGLLATQMAPEFPPGDDNALAGQHEAILEIGTALLNRAKQEGTSPTDTDARDVLRLANAIA
jgi:hypothetical protein